MLSVNFFFFLLPLSPLYQDPVLAELLHSYKDQIVGYHEHDSLLDHKEEEALSEEDRKAAWAEYEAEKKVCSLKNPLLLYIYVMIKILSNTCISVSKYVCYKCSMSIF